MWGLASALPPLTLHHCSTAGLCSAVHCALCALTLLLAALLPQLLTADQVEFWRAPEKAGWMQSQGEHIKTWRRRWFVLKQVRILGPCSTPCAGFQLACLA